MAFRHYGLLYARSVPSACDGGKTKAHLLQITVKTNSLYLYTGLPLRTLKKHWGYDAFRPKQEDIIRSVLDGIDTVGLLPTGGGKSITFQVPALMMDGVTIVVTPLISLMKDQVDALERRGIEAAYLNWGMNYSQIRLVMDKCALGRIKLIYVSPEKLRGNNFLQEIRHWKVSMIVVDEAHCVSQWGHDFRPSYLEICRLRELFPSVPMMALTASATPDVLNDIILQLKMRTPKIVRKSFSRKNLYYIVRKTDDKTATLAHILRNTSGPTIVYVRSRKKTTELAENLTELGFTAKPYHAGLAHHIKEKTQEEWMSHQCRVIVATTAFGMGIDKADVRQVIHYDVPSSLEEYYQEAGRAGRDGLPSYAVSLVNVKDLKSLSQRLQSAFPPKETVKEVYQNISAYLGVGIGEGENQTYQLNIPLFCKRFNYSYSTVKSSLKILTHSNIVDFNQEASIPTRVKIIVGKEDLYDTRMDHITDEVLQGLLRTYTGLFADFVYINEVQLAKAMSLSVDDVNLGLINLSRLHLITYIPQSEYPLLTFVTRREDKKYIEIPLGAYEHRYELLRHQIESVSRFVFDQETCRERILLEYFGEQPDHDCGTCDICRHKRKDPNQ